MNKFNHWLFSIFLNIFLLNPKNIYDVLVIVFVSIVVNYIIDLDHRFNKEAPWYFKRTWIQEPLAILLIAFPIFIILSKINLFLAKSFLITYISHIIADYLCIFPTRPLSPINNKIIKPLGYGIFKPDGFLFFKRDNEKKWDYIVKEKRLKAISENYFTFLLIILFLLYYLLKIIFNY